MTSLLPTSSAALVHGLRVVRGGHEVLRSLSFAIATGTVTGLLGPSGSGKSTLLRCLVGVQRIADGSVHVLGHPAGSALLRPRVGYVTQSPSVYDDLSVAENLRYFAALLRVGGARVQQVLEEVDLEAQRDQLVGRMSGGQRARVGLATALLGAPDLLVLDEPTVGLDPVLREQLWALFARLASDGTTLLVSSHVMDEADRCDRLLLLRDGALLADETPASLRERTGAQDLETAFLRLIDRTRS